MQGLVGLSVLFLSDVAGCGDPGDSRASESPIQIDAGKRFITIHGPPGFGRWVLRLPEKMLLDEQTSESSPKRTRRRKNPDGSLVVEGEEKGEFAFHVTYTPGRDDVAIRLEVTNLSSEKWKVGGEAMACLHPFKEGSREFPRQVDPQRIVLFADDKAQTLETLGRRAWPGGLPRMPSFRVKGEDMASVSDRRHSHAVSLDEGSIVLRSTGGSRYVAFVWDRVHRVSTNLARACIHSNPKVTDLAPGEMVVRRGKIYFIDGDLSRLPESHGSDPFWETGALGRKYRD